MRSTLSRRAGATGLSLADARALALTGLGLAAPRPAKPTRRHLRALARRLGVFQIDAVNVLARAQYLPAYSRLGPYPPSWLDDLVYRERAMFEGSAHALCHIDVELWPLLHWRRQQSLHDPRWVQSRHRIEQERPGYQAAVLAELGDGPRSWNTLSDPARMAPRATKYAESSIMWWRWSDGKTLLEGLFLGGVLGIAGRRNFDPLYAPVDQVIPADVLGREPPSAADAQRELVAVAAGALGVATAKDLADYFRLPVVATRRAAAELVEAGRLETVAVEGWTEPAWVVAGAKPRRPSAQALVSPFDPLVWERSRALRLFGFDYRIEIYVPAPKRVHGYYVLPFLLGDRIVARLDLKADRKRRTLLVPGAFLEPAVDAGAVVEPLRDELATMARWLELDAIEIGDRGQLAPLLR